MLLQSTYKKAIPLFYQELLNQIDRVEVFGSDTIAPHSFVHYQPKKTSIEIHTGSVIKLSHELSHFIEISKNERLALPDFGMRRYYPLTMKGQLQSIARESRAKGIQKKIVELAHGHCKWLFLRTAGDYMNELPAKFPTVSKVKEWSDHVMHSAYKEWTEDKIRAAWKQKAEFINNWLATSEFAIINTEAIVARYMENAPKERV